MDKTQWLNFQEQQNCDKHNRCLPYNEFNQVSIRLAWRNLDLQSHDHFRQNPGNKENNEPSALLRQSQ